MVDDVGVEVVVAEVVVEVDVEDVVEEEELHPEIIVARTNKITRNTRNFFMWW